MEIKGKKAVIVGGASGMAKASAEQLKAKGADIAIVDLPTSAGAEVAKSLGGAFFECNVMDEEQTEAAPACTACLFLTANLRQDAAAILRDARSVWPPTAAAAWESLTDTRWTQRLDVEAIARSEPIDAPPDFDGLVLALDAAELDRIRAEWAADRQRRRNALIGYWTPSQDSEDGT